MNQTNTDGVLTAIGLVEAAVFLHRDDELIAAYDGLLRQLDAGEALDVIGGLVAIIEGFLTELDLVFVRDFIDECRRSALEANS